MTTIYNGWTKSITAEERERNRQIALAAIAADAAIAEAEALAAERRERLQLEWEDLQRGRAAADEEYRARMIELYDAPEFPFGEFPNYRELTMTTEELIELAPTIADRTYSIDDYEAGDGEADGRRRDAQADADSDEAIAFNESAGQHG
jgi:hypothetical protein